MYCKELFGFRNGFIFIAAMLRGGGGGVQAYNFGNFNFKIGVEGEGQNTSQLF